MKLLGGVWEWLCRCWRGPKRRRTRPPACPACDGQGIACHSFGSIVVRLVCPICGGSAVAPAALTRDLPRLLRSAQDFRWN
jgi:hypothetical protein